MGVWIEIIFGRKKPLAEKVTPCVGVWIEIQSSIKNLPMVKVTPCVGVWIEMKFEDFFDEVKKSLPAWECGLK